MSHELCWGPTNDVFKEDMTKSFQASFINTKTGIDTIRSLIHGPLNEGDEGRKVSDIIVNENWDFTRLSFDLPIEILNSIRHIKILTGRENDHPCSLLENNGKFSTRFVYDMFVKYTKE